MIESKEWECRVIANEGEGEPDAWQWCVSQFYRGPTTAAQDFATATWEDTTLPKVFGGPSEKILPDDVCTYVPHGCYLRLHVGD